MQIYGNEGSKYKAFTIAIADRGTGMTDDMGALDAAIWYLYNNSGGKAEAITDQMIIDAVNKFSRTAENVLEPQV